VYEVGIDVVCYGGKHSGKNDPFAIGTQIGGTDQILYPVTALLVFLAVCPGWPDHVCICQYGSTSSRWEMVSCLSSTMMNVVHSHESIWGDSKSEVNANINRQVNSPLNINQKNPRQNVAHSKVNSTLRHIKKNPL